MSFYLKNLPRKPRSPWSRAIHFIFFATLFKSLLLLSRVGCVCKSNILQNYSLKSTNIHLTMLGGKRAASTATSASWSDSTSTQAPLEDCHFITLQLPQTFSSVQFHTMWHYVAKPPPSAADLMWYQWPWEDLFAWQRHLAPAIWNTFLVCAGSKELMPWFEFKS